jgi:nucleotide-binding universal stress UspA family protein
MAIRDILVIIDGGARNTALLTLACDLAARHDARVIGLRCADPLAPVMMYADPSAGLMVADLLEELRVKARAEAEVLEAAFNERLRLENVLGEWRYVEASAWDHAPAEARLADLIIMSQPDGDDRLAEELLFRSGRPVLVMPSVGQHPTPGRHVLIGWNASREATRAVHDALPLLQRAEAVTILAAGADQPDAMPGADIAEHLARHGVVVTLARVTDAAADPADLLRNAAADRGADLIVIGGYGHSRLREMVLGGVTRSLLHGMTVPVMFSH